MVQVNLTDYKNSYIESVKESISSLYAQYDKLVNNSLDKEAINKLHIVSHSLKGRSQVMGFTNIANLSAVIEKISNDILNGVGKVDDKFIVLLKDSIDKLNLEFSRIEKEDAGQASMTT